MVHDQLAGAEGEVVTDVESRGAVGPSVTGVVVPGIEGKIEVPVDDGLVVVTIASHRGSDLDGGVPGEDVFEGVHADLQGALVTAAAEAIHAVRGGPEGRGKVELVNGPVGGGP